MDALCIVKIKIEKKKREFSAQIVTMSLRYGFKKKMHGLFERKQPQKCSYLLSFLISQYAKIIPTKKNNHQLPKR